MNDLFATLPEIDTKFYTSYFLDTFYTEENRKKYLLSPSVYIRLGKADLNTAPINELSNYLVSKFNFPEFSYALMFMHLRPHHPIHIDGHLEVRYSTLNLPLAGYDNTKMVFYKMKPGATAPTKADATYFGKDSVEYYGELEGKNEWVLANSSIPHHIVNVNPAIPRLTMCFRFEGNPKFEDLAALLYKN